MTAQRVVAALAIVFALAHAPFLAGSLEDIDSVNFALGVRDFDVAQHRPHPPGYPVYIALGKAGVAVAGAIMSGSASLIEARVLSVISLLSATLAIPLLYVLFAALNNRSARELDVAAVGATAVAMTCPLFWYLAVRPMSDLPGLALALASQACLATAWLRQRPSADGDTRLSPERMAASGRMIVVGAFLAALSIGVRSQTVWLTAPLLVLVIADRTGRGAAGAMLGAGVTFAAGGLVWGIPLLIASGGLNEYLAALGTQAGEDFAFVDMLYMNPTARGLAFALLRTFVFPWEWTPLAATIIALALAGVLQLLIRDRRALVAVIALGAPYLVFHLLLQDTPFIRYALPTVPVVAFLAIRGAMLVSSAAVPIVAAAASIAGVAIAGPVLVGYAAEPAPAVRAVDAINAQARDGQPGALAMHQTFVRPLQAETVTIANQLPAPPRQEWLELVKYWKAGHREPIWFLADPTRSDLALIDPEARRDSTMFDWPVSSRPAFGGLRPGAVQWLRMQQPGWFAETGWSLTPETSGIARVMGRGPHLGPITAMVRRRPGATRLLIGGRNLEISGAVARVVVSIDGTALQQWEAAPGFFLKVFDIPAGRLAGDGEWATLTVQSTPAAGTAVVTTAIEQFDLQDENTLMWGYEDGWQEAEYSQALGVWRWMSDRAALRIAGPPRAIRVTANIEGTRSHFDVPSKLRARAGDRELSSTTVDAGGDWSFDVPADALAASGGIIVLETDRTFVPAERGIAADRRRLGLRFFSILVGNSLTAAETPR